MFSKFLDRVKEILKYEEVFEQTKAGRWKMVRRYDRRITRAFIILLLLLFGVVVWSLLSTESWFFGRKPPVVSGDVTQLVSEDVMSSDLTSLDLTSGDVPVVEITPPDFTPPKGESARNRWIHIKKSEFKLRLFEVGPNVNSDDNKLIAEWSIATGSGAGDKRRAGDRRTPTGSFSVQSIERSSGWDHDFGDGKGPIRGAYGPWFIRLKTSPWSGIGIHGTHAPDSIGTMATEGCIRMRNSDLLELRAYVKRGMSVKIEE